MFYTKRKKKNSKGGAKQPRWTQNTITGIDAPIWNLHIWQRQHHTISGIACMIGRGIDGTYILSTSIPLEPLLQWGTEGDQSWSKKLK